MQARLASVFSPLADNSCHEVTTVSPRRPSNVLMTDLFNSRQQVVSACFTVGGTILWENSEPVDVFPVIRRIHPRLPEVGEEATRIRT